MFAADEVICNASVSPAVSAVIICPPITTGAEVVKVCELLAPATVVYVKGTGDDAADVKAEAEKMVAALGVGSVQTFDQAAAGGETMDNTDILVVIGQDAVGAL